jgi:maleylpyruvate isomerase
VKLYTYWRSSSVWRVRIALAWKAIPHDVETVALAGEAPRQHSPEFRALNPLGQVPVLLLDEAGADGRPRRITQSTAILEYLEERFPAPPLLPADAWLRARSRQLVQMVNSGIQPLQNLATTNHLESIGGGDGLAWRRHFISIGLAALERDARETAGAFLVGDAPTFADLYLVPQLYNARRNSVDLAPYPTLARVDAACAALPAFQAAHPDAQPDAPSRVG